MAKNSLERQDTRGGRSGNPLRANAPARPVQPEHRVNARPNDTSDGGPVAYDVPEVIRRLGVTRPTIYRFLMSGELRSFRLGSRRLVSAEALSDFIRSRESIESR